MDAEPESLDVPALVEREFTRLRVPSRPEWIRPITEHLQRQAVLCGVCPEADAGKLMLALHEALCNAVIHGNLEVSSELKERDDGGFDSLLAERGADPRYNSRAVEITVDYDGQWCRWIVADEGAGFDVEAVMARVLGEPDFERPSGRGILMMRALVDEVSHEAGGSRVVLSLRRRGPQRRRQARHGWHAPLHIVPLGADGAPDWAGVTDAVARNLSSAGVALLQQNLSSAERILVGIALEGRPVYVPAEVRHCRTLAGGVVELGCSFQTSAALDLDARAAGDTSAAVAKVLDSLRAPARQPRERRAHLRVEYSERIEVAVPGAEARTGLGRNISRGGISFLVTRPLALGPVVMALPQGDGPPLRLSAQVVRCVPISAGFYDVGARFLGLDR
jgi:anti-sigma regulatory factor (Ser/Thr protein kinase)